MKKSMLGWILGWVFLVSLGAAERPARRFAFHGIFTDGMVLQRDQPIVLGGTADPGGTVRVRFGTREQGAAADARGEWRVVFPPLAAGGPYAVMLSGDPRARSIVLDDVLVGEVWLCCGQDGLAMPLFSRDPRWRPKDAASERLDALHPRIRLFQVPAALSPLEPRTETSGGSWQTCTPDTAERFSALAYFFGRELHRRLRVPVGLVQATCLGSSIVAWLPPDTLRDHPQEFPGQVAAAARLRELAAEIRKGQGTAPDAGLADWIRRFQRHDPEASRAAQAWRNLTCDDRDWQKTDLPWRFPDRYDGVVWFRNTFRLPSDFLGVGLELHLGRIDDCDETYFNGRRIGATGHDRAGDGAVERVYRIPAGRVLKGRNTIAVRISDFSGSGGFLGRAADIHLRRTDNHRTFPLAQGWRRKPEFLADPAKLPPMPQDPRTLYGRLDTPEMASTLFNGMVAPWLKANLRGVLWCQGRADAGRKEYYRWHRRLIQDWRKAWSKPGMPFLLVQLGAYPQNPLDRGTTGGGAHWCSAPPRDDVPWALTREIQAEMLGLPGVGMAVSIDRGDPVRIDPPDKQTIAARLAAEAERLVYGRNPASRGPVYNGMRIEKDRIRIYFRNAEPRLKTSDGKMPGCFAIAGKDGRFVWARTQIIGTTVLVHSPDVPRPKNVRYGWVDYRDDLNLCNQEGFPAAPFRTDKPDYSPAD